MTLWILGTPDLPRLSKKLPDAMRGTGSESNCFEVDHYLHQIGPYLEFARVHTNSTSHIEVGRLPMNTSIVILHSLIYPLLCWITERKLHLLYVSFDLGSYLFCGCVAMRGGLTTGRATSSHHVSPYISVGMCVFRCCCGCS